METLSKSKFFRFTTILIFIFFFFLCGRYGISYHGAAQAASGTKEQVASYREKNKQLFQSIGQFARSNR